MKKTVRLVSLLLCLLLCLTIFPVSAFAENILTSGNASWGKYVLYTNGHLVINGGGTIGNSGFWNDGVWNDGSGNSLTIRWLTIEEGVTGIEANTFQNSGNLVTVDLPSSLIWIGAGAFQNCSAIEELVIPGNVTEIYANAFRGCTAMTKLTLSTGLRSIGGSAFRDCTSLKAVTFPTNVVAINSGAFGNCGSLTSITFRGNYPTIADDAFEGVTATAGYPVDNATWSSSEQDPADPNTLRFRDYGGRLTWKEVTTTTQTDGWMNRNGRWYYYLSGDMITDNWHAFNGSWFYFGKDGVMYQNGRQEVAGKYYYFDPSTGVRMSGWHDGEYYGDDGVWQPAYNGVDDTGLNYYRNGWQSVNGNWFYIRNQKKATGWLTLSDGKYYLDPVTGAMVTGWLSLNNSTYYFDANGRMISNRSLQIGGTYYTFGADGKMQGGKIEENPIGLATGWRNTPPDTKWYFYRSDGTMAKNGWELINFGWYYFDKNGVMQTGWLKLGDNYYYLWPASATNKPTGQMVTGWATIGGKSYFFDSKGVCAKPGWIHDGLKWYYLKEDNVIATEWLRIGTKWYYMNPNSNPVGEMVTGTFSINGEDNSFNANGEWLGSGYVNGNSKDGEWRRQSNKWYYYDADNVRLTGWQLIGGKWYYLDPNDNGAMKVGWVNDGTNWYYTNSNGVMQTGWQVIDGVYYYLSKKGILQTGWLKENNIYYFLDYGTGALQKGWQFIDGQWYYLDPNSGAMQTKWVWLGGKIYYMGLDGAQKTEWQFIDNAWYYMNEVTTDPAQGWMVTGWKKIGGTWYCFGGGGQMFHDCWIDGYYLGPDGAMQ